MNTSELRAALTELQGKRTATFIFHGVSEPHTTLAVRNAMLVPEEDDHQVKLTDGQSIFIINADRVAYVRLGTDMSQ
ncbi:MAG: hypothetical protein AAFQ71_13075 [Planctomycetota bacterium]